MKKTLLVILFLILSIPLWAGTYFVTQTGQGTGTGSDYANAMSAATCGSYTFSPGDTVYLCDTFYPASVGAAQVITLSSSGSSGNPIIYRGDYPGHPCIIQPVTTISGTGSWTQYGSTNYYYTSLAVAPTQVFLAGNFVQPAHWPVAVGNQATENSPSSYEYTTAGTGTTTTMFDSNLATQGFTAAQLIGCWVNYFTGTWISSSNASGWSGWSEYITAWDGVSQITLGSAVAPATAVNHGYYLTAPSGTGPYQNIANKHWMFDLAPSNYAWFYDANTNLLYINTPGGVNPGSIGSVLASTTYFGINGTDKNYITIENLTIQYAALMGIYDLPSAGNLTGITISGCTLNWNQYAGISNGIYSTTKTITNSTISGCTVNNTIGPYWGGNGYTAINSASCAICMFGGDNTDLITQNTLNNIGGLYPNLPMSGTGIESYPDTTGTGPTISYNTITGVANDGISNNRSNCLIQGNTVSNTNLNPFLSDGGGIYSAGIYMTQANGVQIIGNTLTNAGKGIYNDQPSSNTIIKGNVVSAGAATGNMQTGMVFHDTINFNVSDNLLIGPFNCTCAVDIGIDAANGCTYNTSPPYTATSSLFDYNIIIGNGTTHGIYIFGAYSPGAINVYNNDIEGCTYGLGGQATPSVAYFGAVENNIFLNNTTHIQIKYAANIGSANYNDYYPVAGTPFVWNSVAYSFANWKLYSSLDANSLTRDPMLTNVRNQDFIPLSGSPVIGAGSASICSGFDNIVDLNGTVITNSSGTVATPSGLVDIGAYQSLSIPPAPPAPTGVCCKIIN